MALETGTHISDLVATNPAGTDAKSTLDDHIKLIKSTLLATFPAVTGAVTPTHTTLNKVGVTQSPGDNTTAPASTAFVQAAIAGVNAQTALTISTVTGTTQTMVAGSHYVFTNAGAVTATFPASPASGDSIGTTFTNSLLTNSVARNGNTIMGLSEDMTIDAAQTTIIWRYLSSSWRMQ